jgi:hypothetical protein
MPQPCGNDHPLPCGLDAACPVPVAYFNPKAGSRQAFEAWLSTRRMRG